MCSSRVFLLIPTTSLCHRTPKILFTIDNRTFYWTLLCLTTRLLLFANMNVSVRSCCIPHCGKTREDNVILHSFPDPVKDKKRFDIWVKTVGPTISSLDHYFIFRNRKVCHDHFAEKYLTWTRRLSCLAVPTLRVPGSAVLQDITNILQNPDCPSTSSQSEYITESSQLVPDSSCSQRSTNSKILPAVRYQVPKTKYHKEKEELCQLLKKTIKKKDSYAARLKKALNLSENTTFINVMKKFTNIASIFFALQLREITKADKGRRFSQEEKIMALSLYKQGPKSYRFLRKAFVLPSPLTLSRLIAKAEVRPGINEKLFKLMKKKIKKIKDDDKLCILLFDEMALTPHFDYSPRQDNISGFATNGNTTQKKIADHALVFMIRGVVRNFKQPIAYTFSSGCTNKDDLAILIEEIVRKLHEVGMRVVATVCDQGTSNVSAINNLIYKTKCKYNKRNEELKRNIFEVDGKEIVPIYDPPHLIKGIRNNLLTKNLLCTINGLKKVGKWEHLTMLHNEDPAYGGIRLLKNLTLNHINPEKTKMKVKYATQIFSQRVASTMGYLADKKILPEECKETADILLFFDNLFDSLNGSYENSRKKGAKPLLKSLTPKSKHNNFWIEAKKVLISMKFSHNGKEMSVPSVKNWLHTIENMEYLRDVLFKKFNIKSIWMRHFNQDPLENFFGAIRSHGCRNVSPSPKGFEIAFASLLINNLTGRHSPGSNCEDDACKNMFKEMKELFKKTVKNNTSVNISFNYCDVVSNINTKLNDPRIRAQLEYVTGFILREAKKHIFKACVSCKQIFYDDSKNSQYLIAREYNKEKQNLFYPTINALTMFSSLQDIMVGILKDLSQSQDIKTLAKTYFYVAVDTDFINCSKHKDKNIEFIYDLVCRFFIYNWCKNINYILKTGHANTSIDDDIKKLAFDYVRKRRKINK